MNWKRRKIKIQKVTNKIIWAIVLKIVLVAIAGSYGLRILQITRKIRNNIKSRAKFLIFKSKWNIYAILWVWIFMWYYFLLFYIFFVFCLKFSFWMENKQTKRSTKSENCEWKICSINFSAKYILFYDELVDV